MDEELGLPLCVFCRTRRTKYKCVLCDSVACNICTNAVGEDHEDFDEDSKRSEFAKTVKVATHYQNVLPTLHVKCKRRYFLCLVEVTKDPSCPLI